ncbi:IS607 family element RNA-guided endonuclease TnpB [Micromonospora sp. DR5-3]|uniref:IS607 family element RNA-guided endonuclease TnpB n=1 Tax=unclassified Micromonospora TaxID=2617518 RepID=UPI0011D65B0E|nr:MULTISPECIES: IS607 family element RNA-guided endonuclease TnpB [unclassified Micromonospora]MCW3816166.1 IS607 family element RNA-guided endonuclease TnpB [Micromonospora sp. DR5-3]TYC25142.1 IS200/IS605 family element transposase accessory protein TnpB [Micromonospora sp. MP36]
MKKFQPRPGFVVQAYRFALDPGAVQEKALRSHCGAARAAYNWAVGWVVASWWQRKAEESYGIAEEELTPWRPWSLPTLRKVFNEVKKTDPRFAGWWEENSKEAYSTGLANAAAAFDNYAKSKQGKRKGKRVGMPRRKSKHTARLACRFTTGTIRVEADRRHVTLPRLGTIRTHESTRKLQRRIANGSARVLSATVRFERGRWFCSLQVEVSKNARTAARPGVVVGVDLGVKCLAVMADSAGEVRYVPNPAHYDGALKHLKRLSRRVSRRQGPDRRAGRKPSRRWAIANAERNRVHHRVANLRQDGLHQLTTAITAEYATVVVEDLNVAGMLRNRRLARKIADAGFAEVRRQITYKTGWVGGETVVANRWYPSSKTCSNCRVVKAKLPLHVRVFTCDACGLVIDRDENAARNLAALAAAVTTGTGVAGDQDAQASNPRGADRKTRATTRSRKATGGRAGGAILPHQRQEETRDRHQDPEALTLR